MPGPQLTDNFMLVAPAGDETYMTGTGKAIGATSFSVNSATGWSTTTGFPVAIRQVDNSGNEIAGTYTEWAATLSGTTVNLGTSPTPLVGTDQVYPAGSTTQVYIPLSFWAWNRFIQALLNQHNQDGSHGEITTTGYNQTSGSFSAPNGSISKETLHAPINFKAYRQASWTPTGLPMLVPLDTVAWDTGSNFSTSSHLFTAPVAGFYEFTGRVGFMASANTTPYAILNVNNGSAQYYGNEGSLTASNTGIFQVSERLELNVGDTVGLAIFAGSATSGTTGVTNTALTGKLDSYS